MYAKVWGQLRTLKRTPNSSVGKFRWLTQLWQKSVKVMIVEEKNSTGKEQNIDISGYVWVKKKIPAFLKM